MTNAPLPHWEQGYRCHGLWRGIYLRGIDARPNTESRKAATLRAGKRQVEKALGLPRCPDRKNAGSR